MCSCPRADLGNGPTRSIPIRSKGTSMMGSGISGLGGGFLGDVTWQVGQAWQNSFTSVSIPGQWNRSRIRGSCWPARDVPPWGVSVPTPTRSPSSYEAPPAVIFPSPLRCATQYSRPFWTTKCGRGWGPGWTYFPSRIRTWAQQCFSRSSSRCSRPNEPPPVTCWNTSKKRLGFWEGDSPSLPLSEARRTGDWCCRFVGARFRRPLPGLAGWVRDARRRSNPGQSRPINTGTGRSFITPTSTGQDPGAAAMVTRRAGTCRVSPWTQVIGRNDLYSVRGARTWDWTRLTVLPESRTARNGFPLTFTSASGAPVGRSWCTMQPASQVRVGGVGGSVGMGSSRGEGTAGLLWCGGMPSGARCSWPTLRGNGGALSPASRCWAASSSSMAPRARASWSDFSCRPPVDGSGEEPGGDGRWPRAPLPGRPRGIRPATSDARARQPEHGRAVEACTPTRGIAEPRR